MNNSKLCLLLLSRCRQKVPSLCRNFHTIQVRSNINLRIYPVKGLSQRQLPEAHADFDIDRSLFFTNLPTFKRRKRKQKYLTEHSGTLILECKNKNLNHYSGTHYAKKEEVPLASKGWAHRKSKGDYFTILPKKKYSPFSTIENLPKTFNECHISDPVVDQLKKINVTQPTVIQAKALELLLSGKNVLMLGECGSGKTLAYVIAMIENILMFKHKVPPSVNSPLGIIVVSSRELAVQVLQLTNSICADLGFSCTALIDGYSKELLENPTAGEVDILVCTANAVVKQLRAEIFSTKYCKHVVVDDIDSFEEKQKFNCLRYFFKVSKLSYSGLNVDNKTQNCAQICFASAVQPSKLNELLHNLVRMANLETASTSHLNKLLYNVPQEFLRLSNATLSNQLLMTLKSNVKNKKPTLIFSNRNKTSNWVSLFLKENGIECLTMNKNDYPSERLQNYRNFEAGFVPALSATNMLSLGFHFPNVKHVINLEFPKFMTDYIHRCGRVGRLGQAEDCLITNYITDKKQVELVQMIEKAVRTNSELPKIICPKYYHEPEY